MKAIECTIEEIFMIVTLPPHAAGSDPSPPNYASADSVLIN